MKLDIERKAVVGANEADKIHQTIKEKDFGHIAYILSSKLYSDPELAVVREYTCNATDAHVENGCAKTPVEIHAPNAFEPTFRVRDFGKGIDFDQMKNMYIHLGDSSKRDSNTGIGCFGIGNMAFRAYTDGMIVTSWSAGEKAVYSLQVGEDNKVFAIILGKSPMKPSDRTGVQIEVSVKPHDVEKFCKKINHLAKFMEVTPKVANLEIVKDKIDVEAEDGSWYFPESDRRRWNRQRPQPVVIMGGVPYQINTKFDGFSETENSLLEDGIVMRFPLGSLSVPPEREKLAYDPKTLRALKARVGGIHAELVAKSQKDLDAEGDYYKFIQKMDGLSTIRAITTKDFKFKGKEVFKALSSIIEKHTDKNNQVTYNSVFSASGKSYNAIRGRVESVDRVMIDKSCAIVKNDTGTDMGINQRLVTIHAKKGFSNFYVVDPDHVNFDKFSERYHLDTWDKDRVLNASDFERTKSAVYSDRQKRTNVKAFLLDWKAFFSRHPQGGDTGYWADVDAEDINNDDVKYYFPISRYKVETGAMAGIMPMSQFRNHQTVLKEVSEEIYGIRVADVKKLDGSWVSVLEHLDKNFDKLFDTEAYKESYIEEISSVGFSRYSSVTESAEKTLGFKDFPNMHSIYKTITKGVRVTYRKDSVRNLYLALGFEEKIKKIEAKYDEIASKSKNIKILKFWREECYMLSNLVYENYSRYSRNNNLTSDQLNDITVYIKSKEAKAKELV